MYTLYNLHIHYDRVIHGVPYETHNVRGYFIENIFKNSTTHAVESKHYY